jgi:hypothetical protein
MFWIIALQSVFLLLKIMLADKTQLYLKRMRIALQTDVAGSTRSTR